MKVPILVAFERPLIRLRFPATPASFFSSLKRCSRGGTHNSNESLHTLIWALAPKERHASLFTVQAAVAEAVMKFNAGNAKASLGILKALSLNPSVKSIEQMTEKDHHLAQASTRTHISAESVQQALKKRHSRANKQSGGYSW